jgi:signal transduction histidine kinase
MTNEEKAAVLKKVHDFSDLPDEQLQWFAENTTEVRLETGEVLFSKGDSPEYMIVFLEGETHAFRDDGMRDGFVYIARAGDPATEITGKLPFSRMSVLQATGRAIMPTRVLLFPTSLFPELIQKMPLLVERLVWKMSDRVRETTKNDEQRDKLIALGKLSAGLAHELNNPAAAARRAASELYSALEELRQTDLNLCEYELNHDQSTFISNFERRKILDLHDLKPLSAMAQSDREEELGEWLDERGVEKAWDFASILADSGVTIDDLDELANEFNDDALSSVVARIAAQISVAKLVTDITNSTGRISELVGAVKEYTYMDRAAVQDVDIHSGIEKTLLILKYKLKKKNISITRTFAEDLPHITAFGSELNQMWTNLIDNAIDAMSDGGHLQIKTKCEPQAVLIEIRDNGAGIPEANQTLIFDPFFTTKPIGEGTGLGLDTVNRIVRRHNGLIRVQSKPGDTCFQVRLPLEQKNGAENQ